MEYCEGLCGDLTCVHLYQCLEKMTKCPFIKFADASKLVGLVSMVKGRAAIQRDSGWRNGMTRISLNSTEGKRCLGQTNTLQGARVGSSSAQKSLGSRGRAG